MVVSILVLDGSIFDGSILRSILVLDSSILVLDGLILRLICYY